MPECAWKTQRKNFIEWMQPVTPTEDGPQKTAHNVPPNTL